MTRRHLSDPSVPLGDHPGGYNGRAERGFSNAVRRLRRFVAGLAWRLSNGDPELAADLAQEAWIKLWELDPLRYDAEDRADQRYLRIALANRMRNVARRERRRRQGVEMVHIHLRVS